MRNINEFFTRLVSPCWEGFLFNFGDKICSNWVEFKNSILEFQDSQWQLCVTHNHFLFHRDPQRNFTENHRDMNNQNKLSKQNLFPMPWHLFTLNNALLTF